MEYALAYLQPDKLLTDLLFSVAVPTLVVVVLLVYSSSHSCPLVTGFLLFAIVPGITVAASLWARLAEPAVTGRMIQRPVSDDIQEKVALAVRKQLGIFGACVGATFGFAITSLTRWLFC